MVTPGARGLFAKVLALDPADARARYFLAMAKDEDGDHASAMADLGNELGRLWNPNCEVKGGAAVGFGVAAGGWLF